MDIGYKGQGEMKKDPNNWVVKEKNGATWERTSLTRVLKTFIHLLVGVKEFTLSIPNGKTWKVTRKEKHDAE